jgi:hypothetical protein
MLRCQSRWMPPSMAQQRADDSPLRLHLNTAAAAICLCQFQDMQMTLFAAAVRQPNAHYVMYRMQLLKSPCWVQLWDVLAAAAAATATATAAAAVAAAPAAADTTAQRARWTVC